MPTIAESGFPGYDVTGWYALLAPAGTPRFIISKLNAELARILTVADAREAFLKLGIEPTGSTPEQLGEMLRTETAVWSKVIRQAGIRAQ